MIHRAGSLFAVAALTASLVAATAGAGSAAQSTAYNAGVTRITLDGAQKLDVLVWYPTKDAEAPFKAGPFTVPATRDADIAEGRFPVVLLSHGGGPTGGSPMILKDFSAALARQGFLVIAPMHRKTPLVARLAQIDAALAGVTADPRFSGHADAQRLGMVGFSLGGAVAIALAGGVPNPAALTAYCGKHPEDVRSCEAGPGSRAGKSGRERNAAAGKRPPLPRLPVKALALLDPFGVLYDEKGLSGVTATTLLIRPQDSSLGIANTEVLAAGLPSAHRETVPGGHFVFTDDCPDALKAEAEALCTDAPGINRTAIRAGIAGTIVDFFRKTL
ncbi:putative dienelactone hydrolase [Rhodobium orientis]|uniref:Dienelactone hydrolase n=1 Tax=Rhodobium orientis TaxID=34017 RepID=A0A327JU75_9HYPH|nr:dienelactone hydrolase [Rhodobium orientis]MBB4303689.1 putative dienelactone hydrolase [Rhodobium orientis]MBK5951856.1 hypothetical protein [Rhodobium orientis]RAI28482.1 hypothetical protein CH339_06220 [Rhodobium orientis]